MSVAWASHFNIAERIDGDDGFDDAGDGGGDVAAAAAAVDAAEMMWMTMALPMIRPVLSYYCANHVHKQCQYPIPTATDTDQLDFLVHQLIDSIALWDWRRLFCVVLIIVVVKSLLSTPEKSNTQQKNHKGTRLFSVSRGVSHTKDIIIGHSLCVLVCFLFFLLKKTRTFGRFYRFDCHTQRAE